MSSKRIVTAVSEGERCWIKVETCNSVSSFGLTMMWGVPS